MRSEPIASSPTEFQLAGTPNAGVFRLVSLIVSASWLAIFSILYILGSASLSATIAGVAATLTLGGIIVLGIEGYGHGFIRLSNDGMTIHTAIGKRMYRWQHIAGVELDEPSRPPVDSPRVGRVKFTLNRSERLSLVPGRAGTAVRGIPSVLLKNVLVSVEEPDRLLAAVHQIRRR